MGTAEKTLVILMRLNAGLLLAALFPMMMPFEWMDATHQWLGMGELPAGPIVGYLTRSISLLYALHGALLLYVSADVRRFLPVVRCLAVLDIALGLGLLALDWNYDLIYSWKLGAEINHAWFSAPERHERFAPWNKARIAVFYPEPFGRTPHWPEHFIAYVRGAHLIKSLPETLRGTHE